MSHVTSNGRLVSADGATREVERSDGASNTARLFFQDPATIFQLPGDGFQCISFFD